MKGFLYFFKYALRKQPKYILLSVLSTVMSALSPVLLIYIPKLILDTAADGFEEEAILFVLLYVASFLILNIGTSWVGYGAGNYSSRLFSDFQMDMSERLMDADLDMLESNAFQEQSEKAKNYIYAGGWGFGYIFTCSMQIIQHSITAISYIYIIYKFSPLVVAVNLLFTLISFRVGGSIKKKRSRIRTRRLSMSGRPTTIPISFPTINI